MSTLYEFEVEEAGSEESNGVFTVGVATSFGPYFMIQRPLDKQKLLPEDIYAEHDDQGKGAYGSLRRLDLTHDTLRAELKDGTTVLATLKLDQNKWIALRENLLRVLAGFDELHNIP